MNNTPADPFDRTRSAGYLANHMARLFAQRLHERIRPLGLAPAQFMTLLELWTADGLTQSDLVERLDVEQATMANTLGRMERDGLIERRADERDARARRIYLTARARTLRKPAEDAANEVNAMALGSMDQDERTQLIDGIARAINGLKNNDGAEC